MNALTILQQLDMNRNKPDMLYPRVMVGGPGCPTVVAELGACPGQGAAKHRKQQEKEMTTVA